MDILSSDHVEDHYEAEERVKTDPEPRLTPHASRNDGSVTRSTASSNPTDGGFWGWMHVLAAWLFFMAAWGPGLTFGSFQNFYATDLLAHESASNLSWIGSISTTLLVVGGAIAGPLYDRGYLKHLMVLGSALMVFAFMMLSLSHTYYQVLLSQGICYGVGAGLVFVPALAFVINSFAKHRAIAIGITSAGASVGGVIFPILFRRLQPRIGFPWTCRVIGFLQLALVLPALAILARAPVRKTKPRRLLEWFAFRSLTFCVFFVVCFCTFLAYWVPLFYIPSYAISVLGSSVDFATYLIVILNASSAVGRVLSALLVPRFGAPLIVFTCTLIASVLLFAWIGITHSTAGFIVWCVVYGFVTGVFVSTTPVVVAHPIISPNLKTVGTRLGMIWFAGGTGALIGEPIAGAIAHPATKDFVGAQAFGGAIMGMGAVGMFWIVIAHRRYEMGLKQEQLDDEK